MSEVARLSLPAAVSTPSYQSLSFYSEVSEGYPDKDLDGLRTLVENISHDIVIREQAVDAIRYTLENQLDPGLGLLALEETIRDRLFREVPIWPLTTYDARLAAFGEVLEDEIAQLIITRSATVKIMDAMKAQAQAQAQGPIQAVVPRGFGRDP